MGVPRTRLAHPRPDFAKQNPQMHPWEREVPGRKMPPAWGRWEGAGVDVRKQGPSPPNPAAVGIPRAMLSRPPARGSRGPALTPGSGPFRCSRHLSWLERRKKGKKGQNPKVKEQPGTCLGGKGSCGMPEGELSHSLAFSSIARSPNAIMGFTGETQRHPNRNPREAQEWKEAMQQIFLIFIFLCAAGFLVFP